MSGRWSICAHCGGEGRTSAHLGEVNPDDFDDEGWQGYVDGAHDRACVPCKGSGKVLTDAPEPIVRHGSNGQPVFYTDADDASEHRLRMAEGWC